MGPTSTNRSRTTGVTGLLRLLYACHACGAPASLCAGGTQSCLRARIGVVETDGPRAPWRAAACQYARTCGLPSISRNRAAQSCDLFVLDLPFARTPPRILRMCMSLPKFPLPLSPAAPVLRRPRWKFRVGITTHAAAKAIPVSTLLSSFLSPSEPVTMHLSECAPPHSQDVSMIQLIQGPPYSRIRIIRRGHKQGRSPPNVLPVWDVHMSPR